MGEPFTEFIIRPPEGVHIRQVGRLSEIFENLSLARDVVYIQTDVPVTVEELFGVRCPTTALPAPSVA